MNAVDPTAGHDPMKLLSFLSNKHQDFHQENDMCFNKIGGFPFLCANSPMWLGTPLIFSRSISWFTNDVLHPKNSFNWAYITQISMGFLGYDTEGPGPEDQCWDDNITHTQTVYIYIYRDIP